MTRGRPPGGSEYIFFFSSCFDASQSDVVNGTKYECTCGAFQKYRPLLRRYFFGVVAVQSCSLERVFIYSIR